MWCFQGDENTLWAGLRHAYREEEVLQMAVVKEVFVYIFTFIDIDTPVLQIVDGRDLLHIRMLRGGLTFNV